MDASIEGRTGAPFTMVVELGKIREFARATKSDHPEYLEGDHPVSPVTFLQTSIFWQTRANSPYGEGPTNFERLLHGEQEFIFHGEPPRAGAVLTGQSRIERVYQKEGRRGGLMTFTESVTEFRDEQGRLVAESKTTGITTERAPSEESR